MKLSFCFILLLIAASLVQTARADEPAKVSFREDGIVLVNAKPFFPIGIWVYELNADVMADLHERQFNAIVGNGFGPDKLDFIHEHGMKAVPIVTEDRVAKGKGHPALLAWCLIDEPEGRMTPQETRERYLELKKKDPNHPIGIDQGKTTKEIADLLHVSPKTIESHRGQIIEKLGVRTVAELTKIAIRDGLTSLGS